MATEKLFEEAIANIRKDRKTTESLLQGILSEISASETSHSKSGIVAAKYVEVLQRSNEQLVKLIASKQKQNTQVEDVKLSKEEAEDLFDILKEAV